MTRHFTPHDYQVEAVQRLCSRHRLALWMPMGGGKTACVLTALDNLSAVEEVYPALVLAPLRVARSVWPDEIRKWEHTKHLRISVVTGSPKEREEALRKPADIYAMNYDNLPWLVETLGDDWPFVTVVADEHTRLKSYRRSQGSKRAQALSKVAHTKAKRFIGLTGTPSPNGLKDLWGQAWFLDQGVRLGRSFSAFADRWFHRGYDGYTLKPTSYAQEEIEEKLKDICFTIKVPPTDEPVRNKVYVDLPGSVRDAYDDMERDMFAQIRAHGVTAANAAVKTIKCRQMANGAIYTDNNKDWVRLHNAKIEALESIIEEAGGAPVLVAYEFRHDLERLQKAFPEAKVLGKDPKTIADWNAGTIPILLAHPACLHPATEVLTEFRGWRRIVDVTTDDRVFDGHEFVSHAGCAFSGRRNVIDVFGITMTPEHRLLVGGVWREGRNVDPSENLKEEARYTYAGDDGYLSEMLALPKNVENPPAKLSEAQSSGERTLPEMPAGDFPPSHRHAHLAFLARVEEPGAGYVGQRLRWTRDRGMSVVDGFQSFLRGHGADVSRWLHDRARRCERWLLERELQMGLEVRSAGEQTQHQTPSLPRDAYAPRGTLSAYRIEPLYSVGKIGSRDDSGPSGSLGESFDVQKEQEEADVYDLVDCGPRHCFVVRNSKGEVFVSHNSAGHGLNLADGGNILVFFGINWNLEEHMQIIERIGPLRQRQAGHARAVFIHYILADDTVDDMILERLQGKKSAQDVLLAAMARRGNR